MGTGHSALRGNELPYVVIHLKRLCTCLNVLHCCNFFSALSIINHNHHNHLVDILYYDVAVSACSV